MATTWDSVTWLSKNYDTDNGIPIFFIKGNYLPSQQLLAEAEYKVTVDILKESEDSASREWAKKIHLSDYLPLKTLPAITYWQSLTFTVNTANDLSRPMLTRFIMSGPEHYSEASRSTLPAATTPAQTAVRRRIEVEENDGIMLSGMYKSLMSHIKTMASNRMFDFDNLDEKAKCRIVASMNNILDLDDIAADGLYFSLGPEQQDEIAALFEYTPSSLNIHREADINSLLKRAHRNWNHAISMLYSQIGKASDLEIATTYKIAVHLAEVHFENDNIFEHESSLSEADFIVKVWGHIIEKLFYKTNVFCRWGDTISQTEANDYTSHRLDLRMLCKSNLSKYDICDGEFGKKAFPTKVYHDKVKLIMNGKNQLNYILKNHSGELSEVKITLLQVLGFEADLYQMWLERDGVYILKKIKHFAIPTISRHFAQGMGELLEGLSILRFSALELAVICNDDNKKIGRLQAVTNPSPNPAINRSVPTRAVWIPPVNTA